jgi:menaquinone-9 beta-reductase
LNTASTPSIVISGAGPAGAIASAFLSREKIPHIIIDRAIFPRDKICGDALSGKVIPILKKLDPGIQEELFSDTFHNLGSWGIHFAAPNGKSIDIPFGMNSESLKYAPGFLSKRMDFDYFLTRKINPDFADFRQGHELVSIQKNGKGHTLQIKSQSGNYDITNTLLIAADGERSLAAKNLGGIKKEPSHFCGGIRAYYTGVAGLHPRNFIELHFIDELLPGYLWIFPMPGGIANVGAGMLSSSISRKKVNLREAMLHALDNNPTLKSRFINARPQGKIEGWGLPLGSKRRTISGDHFMLAGDAASMIDPFTGEGISNAMYCGMTAALTASAAIKANNFSAGFLKQYDDQVYRRLWNELRLSYTLQKLCNYPWLFNFVINKAGKNKTFRETISCMFDDMDLRARLKNPAFYFRLLFNS